MLEKLYQLKNRTNSVSEFCEYVRQGIPSAVFGVNESFKNFLLSQVDSPIVYIVKDFISANVAVEQIYEFSGKNAVFIPAKDEILMTGRAFSKERLYERLTAISQMENADVLIVTPETIMQIFPKKLDYVEFEIDKEKDLYKTVSELVSLGYLRVESVESKGCFSLRGDVLEVFPIDAELPFRVDFFGDTIENIKKINPETRKFEGVEKSFKALQANEFCFTGDDLNKALEFAKSTSKIVDKAQETRRNILLDDLRVAISNKDLDILSVFGVLSKDATDFFSLIKKDSVIIFDEAKRLYDLAEFYQKEFLERFSSLERAGEVFSFSVDNLLSLEKIKEKSKEFRLSALQTLTTTIPFFNPLKIVNPNISGVANYHLDFKEIFTDVDRWVKTGYTVLMLTEELKRAEKLSFDFSTMGIASSINGNLLSGINIVSQKLSSGFIFHEEKLAVIGSGNLYAKTKVEKKSVTKKKGFFSAPETGDYCVHEVHGVGRVIGNKKISTTEGTKDYVAVEYHGGDVLYVPVEQMDILTRYLGSDKSPRLSKIGGGDFEKVKQRVVESIKKMSFDLKKLYSERTAVKGFEFQSESELEQAFLSDFPFESTLDQVEADEQIKQDMESDKVMDRLVCGDVGFGKTEVAFRAVFRAIVNGKQCAMLAPTTILTEQHYNTAVERFKNFGVKIAVLNRFKSAKEQRQILQALKNGDIDFIIGTHRLLSKDVEFKDLGLLILDEEQRFGVEHKEKIKLLKKDVDALTLTAAPIPRTLHMSLSGIRDISTINTPPKKRLPVQTYVTEETDTLIKDAILKEIGRGGQAFILYNRVESIFSFADHIQRLMPEVKLTVVHGQMDEKVMEKNIVSFYRGERQLLISTTIIENGIDLPKANTMLVIDADKMGLSTLYQLKGRVGRSDRLAYAYFTFKRDKVLTTTAFERLNAIIEFAEMGSGIKIAMRDLEIRGAGNILGAEQHGHMDKIGYELYSKLLKEEMSGEKEKIPELDVRVSAFIPDWYMESGASRMEAYKEIAEIDGYSTERQFRTGCKEVFGEIPEETDNLINIAVVKRKASKYGVENITVSNGETFVQFDNFKVFANDKLMKTVEKFSKSVKISMSGAPKLEFLLDGANNSEKLTFVRRFFDFVEN